MLGRCLGVPCRVFGARYEHLIRTPRKWVDVERLRALGWSATTPLSEGLSLAYQDFLERYQKPA